MTNGKESQIKAAYPYILLAPPVFPKTEISWEPN